jgi:hypothetical protein
MRFPKRSTQYVAAVCVVSGVLAMPTVAGAAGPPATCSPEGTLCIYEETGYQGGYDDYTYSNATKDKWLGRMGKFAHSIYNYRNLYRTWISNDAGGTPAGGQQACLKPNYQNTDLYEWYYSTGSAPSNITIYDNLRGYYLSSSSASCGGWAPWELVDDNSPSGTSPGTTTTAPTSITTTSALVAPVQTRGG